MPVGFRINDKKENESSGEAAFLVDSPWWLRCWRWLANHFALNNTKRKGFLPMKLWLARKQNGLYQLTKFKPISTNIFGTDIPDVFVEPGDPINFQGLCPFSVKALFQQELQKLQIIRVNLAASILPSKELKNIGLEPGVLKDESV